MNEATVITEKPRVWGRLQIFFATVLGSYLAGFYLMSQNYIALQQPSLAKKALLCGIISSIVLFSSIIFLPQPAIDRFVVFLNIATGIFGCCYLAYAHSKNVTFLLSGIVASASIIAFPFFFRGTIPSAMEHASAPFQAIFV